MEQAQANAERLEERATGNAADLGGGSAEVSAAYERARKEVQEAIARLRTEIARIDFEQARVQARDWIRNNPELASLMAVGAGLILGRVIGGAMKPEPPPTFGARVRGRAGTLATQAQRLAEELSESILDNASHAGEVVTRTARAAGRQAQDMGSDLTKRASIAAAVAARGASEIGEELAERARTYGDVAARTAKRTARDLDKQSRPFRKQVGKRAGEGIDYAETALGAARTLVAATLIKRVNNWLKD